MSTMSYIRPAPHDELVTVIQDRARGARAEVGPSIAVIVASVAIMAGLMAFRLWFLMPASFQIQN
jgi:hypothetical protein